MVHSQGGDTRNLKCSQTDRGVHPGVGLEDRQKGEVSFSPAPTQTDFGHGHRHVFASPNVKLRQQIPGKGGTPFCSPSRATAPPKRDPAAPPCLLSPQAFPAMPDLCDNPSTADTGQASGEPRRRRFFHPARGSEHPRAARPYTPIPHRPARPGHTPRTKPRPPGGAGEVSARGWSPRPGQTPQNPRPGRQHL